MANTKIFTINQPWSISLIYMVLGINWILFSDTLVSYILSDNIREMFKFQIIKGCFYVLVTGVLLFYMMSRFYVRINRDKRDLELLFTNPNLGIFKIDQNFNFTHVGQNTQTIIGYSQKDILGKNLMDFTPPEFRVLDQKNLDKISSNHPENGFILKKHLVGKQGNSIILKISGIASINKKGEITNYVASFQDITQQEKFLKSLESKNRHMRELASDQSHLVRAPLARILSIVELLQNVDLESSEKGDLIKHLKNSGEELDAALRDISQKMAVKPSTH